jgi:hypothetical protein
MAKLRLVEGFATVDDATEADRRARERRKTARSARSIPEQWAARPHVGALLPLREPVELGWSDAVIRAHGISGRVTLMHTPA